ncbi:MAG: ammonia-forming cytochrome c nitrite reductase subunit c552 [Bryobacteraceae bacterium]
MKYLATALAAAVLAFLVASLLVRERATVPRPPSAAATFEQRFPEQAAAYHQPASVDARWQEKRGHAWSIADREETDPEGDPRWTRILGARPKLRPQPTACLTCHAAAGTARASSYYEARDRKPLGCPDCHERQGDLRSAVCEQCHREYYIVAGQAAFPEGRTADQIEAFYESRGTGDWIHAGTGAVVLKAQHPQFEMHAQGPHARAGVACADCHMPFERRGATRITDHRATRPLENIGRACLSCHGESAGDLLARVKETEARTRALLSRAEDALVAAIDAIEIAQAAGARPAAALELQTKAQWRLDFVAADRSLGFHAPQESARLLAEAIDYARQAQLAAARSAIK